jgi:chemotaxis protein MotB
MTHAMRAFHKKGYMIREDMMRISRMQTAVVGLIIALGLTGEGIAAWYMQEGAPNDSVSRGLNEMKAKARPLPPVVDPRDARIAALEKQIAGLETELNGLRGTADNLSDANRRVSVLEQQLADRDRELASLRSSAGDSAGLAGQLSSTQADLARSQARATELEGQLAAALLASAGLQAGIADKDKLASELAAEKQRRTELEAQLAAAQSTGIDRDKLASELAAEKQRRTELEAQLAAAQSTGIDRDKLASELAAEKQRRADIEKQLADRNRELAGLRGDLSAEMAKLKEAERGLVRALRPEIAKGTITVDVNNERLLINLASSMLFGSGEDELKPAGAEALKRIGGILKDYPEYKVEVDGHTDNRPIRSSLKKRFPTNKELSEARALNGVTALTEGGVSASNVASAGYADTKPVAPNTTDVGRQKNRRVEVRVAPKS